MRLSQLCSIAITVLSILLPSSRAAAVTLTLDDCIARAMAANPEVKAYESGVREAEAGVGEAWGAFLPTLSFSYDHSQVFDSSGQGNETDYIDQQSDRLTARISQPLFAGLGNVAALQRARYSRQYSQNDLRLMTSQLVRDIRLSFNDILRSRETQARRAEAVTRLEEQVRIAQAWVAQALAPRVYLLETEVALSNARQELIVARTELVAARARLEELLAMDAASQLDIAGSLQDENGETCATVEECVERALVRRLEPEMIGLRVDMARQDARGIVARSLPRASLDLSWTDYQRDYDNPRLSDDDRDYYSLYLNVTFQPFQGGRDIFAYRRQIATIDRLQNMQVKQQHAVVTEVRTRFEQLQESRARLGSAHDSLAQAREAYQLMKRSVELGVSSLRDFLDTAILLTRAEINLIASYHALQQAKAQLDYAVGN